jgi:hypothetical protein
MLRFGAPAYATREMNLDDIFNARLRLLIVMANAYLEQYTLGDQRCRAMLENARHVESESIALGNLAATSCDKDQKTTDTNHEHLFYQRVKLLAMMVKTVAKGFPIEEPRKAVLRETLDAICSELAHNSRAEELFPIKVI